MKKTKAIALILAFVILTGCVVRAIWLNLTFPKTPVKIYETNETVEYGRDFYAISSNSNRTCEGYSITVHKGELLTLDEYAKKHDIDSSIIDNIYYYSFKPQYVFDIDVTITADETIWKDPFQKNKYASISLLETYISSDSLKFSVDGRLMLSAYPEILQSDMMFWLEPNTTKRLSFTFTPNLPTQNKGSNYIKNLIKSQDFYFIVSLYPTKKMIRIDFDESGEKL